MVVEWNHPVVLCARRRSLDMFQLTFLCLVMWSWWWNSSQTVGLRVQRRQRVYDLLHDRIITTKTWYIYVTFIQSFVTWAAYNNNMVRLPGTWLRSILRVRNRVKSSRDVHNILFTQKQGQKRTKWFSKTTQKGCHANYNPAARS